MHKTSASSFRPLLCIKHDTLHSYMPGSFFVNDYMFTYSRLGLNALFQYD
jgi:hypothetical protein